jgi:hypothetical protein
MIASLALLMGADTLAAPEPRPLREVESSNHSFRLQIRPGRPDGDALRGCRATLYEYSSEYRQRGRARWGRFLVNEIAPEQAFIRDDGEFVVTLNEFQRGGARHALIIYGRQGELLRHFVLPDLLEPGDWPHVRVEGEAIEWLKDVRCEFVGAPESFVITLPHGRQIRISLATLQVIRDKDALKQVAGIPAEARAALYGTAAAGQSVGRETAEEKNAANGGPAAPPSAERTPPTATASAPMGDPGQSPTGDREPPPAEVALSEAALVEAPGTSAQSAALAAEQPDRLDPAQYRPAAMAVPPPDPAEPVDYIAWANELTRTEGASAVSDYEIALRRLMPWDGDRAPLGAALRGEVAALRSPAIRAWLEANHSAMAYYRSAAELEYRGWPVQSDDGWLLSATLPYLPPLRDLAQAAVIQGRVLAAENRPADAAEYFLDVLSAGTQTSYGITIIEALVGATMQTSAAGALLDLQAADAELALDYGDLAERVATAYAPICPLEDKLQLERAVLMEAVQRVYRYDAESGTYVLDRAQAAGYFEMMTEMLGAAPQADATRVEQQAAVPFAQVVAEGEAYYDALAAALSLPYAQACARLQTIYADALQDPNLSPIMRINTPDFTSALLVQTRAEAMRRGTQLATRLRAYRQSHGAYPDSLDELGEAHLALDPFTDRPFHYRRTADEFVLYSAGANGNDNGGHHDERAETGDFVIWPRPKAR